MYKVTAAFASAALAASLTIAAAPARSVALVENHAQPIIVELFSSEGCSSCPPADLALRELERDQPIHGAQIIGLEEHVDYWDHDGWRDPFSSAEFTRRQNDYSGKFHLDSLYTPQMIVDGRAQFDGGDTDAARAAIVKAESLPKALVSVRWSSGDQISTSISDLPGSPARKTIVWLAITQSGLSTRVLSGENGGSTLVHSSIVRSLRQIGTISAGSQLPDNFDAPVSIPGTWSRGQLAAVVFVQDPSTGAIIGAGEAQTSK